MPSVFEAVRKFLDWCLLTLLAVLEGLMILATIAAIAAVIHAGWLVGVDVYLFLVRW